MNYIEFFYRIDRFLKYKPDATINDVFDRKVTVNNEAALSDRKEKALKDIELKINSAAKIEIRNLKNITKQKIDRLHSVYTVPV